MSMMRALERNAAVQILSPVALVLLANVAIFAAGAGTDDPRYLALPYAPPGWFVAVVWIVLYLLWASARWMVMSEGEAGRRAGFWILGLMGWGFLFPVLTKGFELGMTLIFNAISLAFIVFVSIKILAISRRAALLMLPSILWASFANFLGWASYLA